MTLGLGVTGLYIALGSGAAAGLFAGVRHITRDRHSRAELEPLRPAVFLQADPPPKDVFLRNYERALFRSENTREYF